MSEIQQEELEVLQSIYEGEEAFKQISDTVFQYKYGEDGTYKSFVVEISWPADYPDVAPDLNLDVFYNKHVAPEVKETIKSGITEQVEEFLGMSMTFSLFEWIKDNLDDILSQQPDHPVVETVVQTVTEEEPEESKKEVKEKKEQLTKAQKRRMFDKFGHAGDRPRGWDWVDIIKHLSKTGNQE